MNSNQWACSAGWSLCVVIGLCAVCPALAQEGVLGPAPQLAPLRGDGDLPNPAGPLPLPFAKGNPWSNNSLLAPLPKRPIPKRAPQREEVSPQVRELEGVMPNSPLRGTIVDSGNPEENEAERRRLFAKFEQERLERERSNTQRVSDDGEHSPGPILWPTQQDPLQAATMLLRASARQFDALAADLEEAGKYSEADRLRARAKQLRGDARSFSQSQETVTPR